MAMITDRVDLARRGANDTVICRLPSGWAVLGDVQVLPGWCLLLPDPVVPSLNDLDDTRRAEFLRDMVHLGDAILQITSAERINYEILGNSEPELHAHVIPRYATEPPERRRLPAWFYDWEAAPRYDPEACAGLREALRNALVDEAATVQASAVVPTPDQT
jgi:diadenosine tetraphosphate (Ap4A) HIT family hydrolase